MSQIDVTSPILLTKLTDTLQGLNPRHQIICPALQLLFYMETTAINTYTFIQQYCTFYRDMRRTYSLLFYLFMMLSCFFIKWLSRRCFQFFSSVLWKSFCSLLFSLSLYFSIFYFLYFPPLILFLPSLSIITSSFSPFPSPPTYSFSLTYPSYSLFLPHFTQFVCIIVHARVCSYASYLTYELVWIAPCNCIVRRLYK